LQQVLEKQVGINEPASSPGLWITVKLYYFVSQKHSHITRYLHALLSSRH